MTKKIISTIHKICLILSFICFLGLIFCLIKKYPAGSGPFAVFCIVLFAIGIASVPALRGYRFTVWIIAAVVCGMLYPQRFLHIGTLDLRNPWLILIVVQLVMFGMGTQMSLKDFAGVLKM